MTNNNNHKTEFDWVAVTGAGCCLAGAYALGWGRRNQNSDLENRSFAQVAGLVGMATGSILMVMAWLRGRVEFDRTEVTRHFDSLNIDVEGRFEGLHDMVFRQFRGLEDRMAELRGAINSQPSRPISVSSLPSRRDADGS